MSGLTRGVLAGPLVVAVGEPVDGRHLGAGVGGRQRDLSDVDLERDRLAEAGRRSAADGHDGVDVELMCHLDGGCRLRHGHVLDHVAESTDDEIAEDVEQLQRGSECRPMKLNERKFPGDAQPKLPVLTVRQ